MFQVTKTIRLALAAIALTAAACGPDRTISSPTAPAADVAALLPNNGLITSPSGVVFLADEWAQLADKSEFMVSTEQWAAKYPAATKLRMANSVTGQVGPRILCHQNANICNYAATLVPGSTVVRYTDAQWLAATTADFKQFDIIYLHDAFGARTSLAPSKNVWGAAISGRAIITGTHFDNHCGGVATQGPCIAWKAALNWVHAGTGTGLVVSTQNTAGSGAVMIPTIPPFSGVTYAQNGSGYDLVHITEPGHLTMLGSTDASLSNFSQSAHSFFASVGSFTTVATVCDIAFSTYPGACGGGRMVPYYIVTSVAIADQDGDGVPDASDNCPTVANANQADANGNGVGDACESAPSVTLSPSDLTVAPGTAVNFTTVVTDADNALSTMRYEWRVNGIVQPGVTGPTFSYIAAANATVRVTVKDPGELSGFDETRITVPSDATPPVVTPIVAGTLGTNGWYTSDVGVSWTATDAQSAITSPACASSTVTSDTNGATFTCSATSLGGTTTESVTIKRDASTPTVAAVVPGPDGLSGWYVSNVNVSWAVTANGPSGATSSCVVSAVTSNTLGQTFTCAATSGAGITGSESITIKRDDSTPTVTPSVSGELGWDDWFIRDVTIGWSVTANGPSGATSGCTVSTLTTDTPGQTFECSAISGAGKKGLNAVTVKRDASIPVITPNVSGTLGLGGWYTSDVSIGWSVTGGLSGASAVGCNVSVLNTNTTGEEYQCEAVSGAGIRYIRGILLKRDATVPKITPYVSGTEGLNGWYTSNVSVSWVVDADGPSAGSASCPVSTLSTDDADKSYSCTATTGAGLSKTESVSVKRDASIPTVTPHVSGDLGTGGWYTSDVNVTWTVDSHGPSGAAISCPASTLSTNTASQSYSCTGASGAGLPGSASVTVMRDASTPTVTPVVTGTMGNAEWYTSNVGISWNVISNGPSLATSTCTASTLATDTPSQSYACSATSGAGITGSNGVTVKRDATTPVIGYAGNAGTYTVDQNVSISCSASDALSGLASSTCLPISGTAHSFGVGTTTRSASALDIAGNTNSATTSFTVKATAASLCTLTREFVTGPGEQGIENSLCGKLEKGNYAQYINEVQAQSGKKISVANANILITWASTL